MTFPQQPELRSPVILTLAQATLDLPGGPQLTRGFNGRVPGPTIRVSPGELLSISVVNALGAEPPPTSALDINTFQHFNTTTFHTHGFHVSPRAPADDVFVQVAPGETRLYQYDVPSYHMGGTHWYHPHMHGASTMQVGGGALGLLIVDDPPGSLPPEVAAAPERHLVISDLRGPSLARVAARRERACVAAGGSASGCREPMWTAEATANAAEVLMLVNGLHDASTHLDAGVWYRVRMLFGSAGGAASSQSSGMMMGRRLSGMMGGMMGGESDYSGNDLRPRLAGCETSLLAKDGVYLPKAPRPIERGFMSAGNRADWLVRCPVGEHTLVDETTGSTLLRISATAPASARSLPTTAAIEPFAVARPCYLADLAAAPVAASHDVSLAHMSWKVNVDGRAEPFHGTDPPAARVPVGAVTELHIGGTSVMHHVFHMHVNPFQLMDEPPAATRAAVGNYIEKGDWHDTFRLPIESSFGMMAAMGAGPVRARFQTDRFTGLVPVHCHYLVHEDQGMLAAIEISGEEGTRFHKAEALDPTCYRQLPAGAWRRIARSEVAPIAGGAEGAAQGGMVAMMGAAPGGMMKMMSTHGEGNGVGLMRAAMLSTSLLAFVGAALCVVRRVRRSCARERTALV